MIKLNKKGTHFPEYLTQKKRDVTPGFLRFFVIEGRISMKRIVSLVLMACILCSMLAMVSCGYILSWPKIKYPEGYTGGFSYHLDAYPQTEYHWVETYDEAMAAVELLESHGSTFVKSPIFSYDGDLFDTKYCFVIESNNAEFVQFGDDPFDRRAENVRVHCYGFFEDVTIDEIVYSFVKDYDKVYLSASNDIETQPKNLRFKWDLDNCGGNAYDDANRYYFSLDRSGKNGEKIELSEECVNAIMGSIEFVGLEKNHATGSTLPESGNNNTEVTPPSDGESEDKNPPEDEIIWDHTGKKAEYHRRKAFDSFDEFVSAWFWLGDTMEDEKKNFYVVPDTLGEEYQPLYMIGVENCVTYYPISVEEFCTYLPPIEQQYCPYRYRWGLVKVYLTNTSPDMCDKTGEVYHWGHGVELFHGDDDGIEKYAYLKEHLFVYIRTVEYVEIEDRSLITVSEEFGDIEGTGNKTIVQDISYKVYYDGTYIACLHSCIPLDSEQIDLLVNNLCGINSYDTPPSDGEENTEVTPPSDGEENTEITPPSDGEENTEITPPSDGEENTEITPPSDGEENTEVTPPATEPVIKQLSEYKPWLNELTADQVAEVKISSSRSGVAPGSLSYSCYFTDAEFISELLREFGDMKMRLAVNGEEMIPGGSSIVFYFITEDGESYVIGIGNGYVWDDSGYEACKLDKIPSFSKEDAEMTMNFEILSNEFVIYTNSESPEQVGGGDCFGSLEFVKYEGEAFTDALYYVDCSIGRLYVYSDTVFSYAQYGSSSEVFYELCRGMSFADFIK